MIENVNAMYENVCANAVFGATGGFTKVVEVVVVSARILLMALMTGKSDP